MKKILIATRNNDKFKIVSKLLSTDNFSDATFYSLKDIEEVIVDEKETGDLMHRSFQKANNAYNVVKGKYDYVIGVDDGIKIKGEIVENVKDYIKKIIEEDYLAEKEAVYIVRAYTFINKCGDSKTILTEIPFEFIKCVDELNILENSYPLSYVLAPVGTDIPVIKLSEEESNLYYFKYSKCEFDKIDI